MEMTICAPSDYYNKKFQKFITNEKQNSANKWIYDLIYKEFEINKETIYLDRPSWLLCQDCNFGPQERFLVVFKDTTLHSIRDLRKYHIPLLNSINKEVQKWLSAKYTDKIAKSFEVYFHYIPSIFQLHLHVNQVSIACTKDQKVQKSNGRKQPLHVVINNLSTQSDFYANCMILTKFCKTLKRAETHRKILLPI